MTPTELVTFALQRWNEPSGGLFSDSELYTVIWSAQLELAQESLCIRKVYTTPTVASQQEYAKPTNAISIKRITYEGQKLFKITDREDDALTLNNQTVTATGTPMYYWEWDAAIELRPVPGAVGTLKIYTYDLPQTVTASTVIDVPLRYHPKLANYMLAYMAEKDKNFQAAGNYRQLWMKDLQDAKRYEKKFLRGDAMAHMIDEELAPLTTIGVG
jgi:hypothetical protein